MAAIAPSRMTSPRFLMTIVLSVPELAPIMSQTSVLHPRGAGHRLTALRESDRPVCADMPPGLRPARRPAHFYPVHALRFSKSEILRERILRKVTAAAYHFRSLLSAAGLHRATRA